MFFRTFVFERSSKLYLFRDKIIASLLVWFFFLKKNTCLGCQIALICLFRDANFSPRNTCLGCFFESMDEPDTPFVNRVPPPGDVVPP